MVSCVSCLDRRVLCCQTLDSNASPSRDGGLSLATPTAGTLGATIYGRRSEPEQFRSKPAQRGSNLRLELFGSCATENVDPGRSHRLRNLVAQFSLWIGLLAIASLAVGQSEPKNAAVVNGQTTISYMEPAKIVVATEGRPSRGAPDAPVTIVEFSDFQCPYCATLFSTLKAIEKN